MEEHNYILEVNESALKGALSESHDNPMNTWLVTTDITLREWLELCLKLNLKNSHMRLEMMMCLKEQGWIG